MSRTPSPSPKMCSVQWDEPGLSCAGSAAQARFWVALEQNGPWGHDAIGGSHLPPELGRDLERRCADAGGRLLLVRRPGAHRDAATPPRRILVAGGLEHGPWLVEATIPDATRALALPFDVLARADSAAEVAELLEGHVSTDGVLLVCTNGKRDICCAVRARPVVLGAAAARPGLVWECSHTGGHRFAPTGIVLPTGQTLARLTTELAVEAIDAAGRGELAAATLGGEHDRGMSFRPAAAQAAESWARAQTGRTALGGVDVSLRPVADGYEATVRTEGNTFRLAVAQRPDGERKDSCAKPAVPSRTWHVEPL